MFILPFYQEHRTWSEEKLAGHKGDDDEHAGHGDDPALAMSKMWVTKVCVMNYDMLVLQSIQNE